jgi:hypothetical protein
LGCVGSFRRRNLHKFKRKLQELCDKYDNGEIDYDTVYDTIEGWCAYAANANTYKLRKRILGEFEILFSGQIATKEINQWAHLL